ncbi:stage II sporulation protein P [Keratinibaculum paraultunense]|uniref:Stage II sporulation protein P n=1 Tax=Keratinibaculum paraultunense TaxID=1278232 RepID=A0A4R3KZR5_9FIRM|nr:stage II sporulation protein P [Keratinibaculum paraultunense]QQY80454.1 stage II sporulation protein P [Keratinibaculum paraultunense]TCS91172.1 stage II sporulation protein P [Keratinibaculum paraultunense]
MKQDNMRNTYIILVLLCLLVFNIGTIFINIIGNEEDKAEYKSELVFNQYSPQEVDSFYITLFGRTSSIINLYKNKQNINESWKKNLISRLDIKDSINRLLKAQFPYAISFKENNLDIEKDKVSDDDAGESPTIIEDFIIIDRLEEYEDFIIINDSEGNVDIENVPKPINVKPLKIDKDKPYILLYHTHGTESYYVEGTNQHHTTDRRYNVTTIGEKMAQTLIEKGHKVEHVTTYHDIPSYNKSYSRSLSTITKKLEENNNLKILLDIHRDGYDSNDPKVTKNMKKLSSKTKVTINGRDVATFYFVIGPDSPNKEEVLNFVKYFKAVSDAMYPDLCTGILIKPKGKYNQFLSNYSALIELGSNLNTMEEAVETAKLVAEILSVVIDNIEQK